MAKSPEGKYIYVPAPSIIESSGLTNWTSTIASPSEAKLEAYRKVRDYWKENKDMRGGDDKQREHFESELQKLEQLAKDTN